MFNYIWVDKERIVVLSIIAVFLILDMLLTSPILNSMKNLYEALKKNKNNDIYPKCGEFT